MEKSIYSEDHQRLAGLLRDARTKAGLTQAQVAERLDEHQSFVSKYESGERRLDLVELRSVCGATGTDLIRLIRRWLA